MERQQLEFGVLKDPFKVPYLHRKMTFSFDNKYLAASGRQDGEAAFVWELSTGKLVQRPALFGNSFLEFAGNTQLLVGDGAKIWNVENNHEVTTTGNFQPEEGVRWLLDCYFDHCLDLSPSGQYLLGGPLHDSAYYYYNLGLWELQSGSFIKRFSTPRVKHNNAKVRFSGDNQRFMLAAQLEQEDTGLHLSYWEVASGKKLGEWTLEIGVDDYSFGFSEDGAILMAGSKGYRLAETAPQEITGAFWSNSSQSPHPVSKVAVDNSKLMVVRQPGELLITDIVGQPNLSLAARYVRTGQAADGVKDENIQLQPRLMASSRDGQYYAAGDDRVILVWKA
jgi:WD40 repeat protein